MNYFLGCLIPLLFLASADACVRSHVVRVCDGDTLNFTCADHHNNHPAYQYIRVSPYSAYGRWGSGLCQKGDYTSDTGCTLEDIYFRRIVEVCDAQKTCNVKVGPEFFGKDPCPGVTKYLVFDVSCIGSPTGPDDHVNGTVVGLVIAGSVCSSIALFAGYFYLRRRRTTEVLISVADEDEEETEDMGIVNCQKV